MRNRLNLPKFQPATVISLIALFVAVGGTATAASGLLDGKNIKNGSIAGKKLKRGAVTTAKIAPATRKALRGRSGPRGAKGRAGRNGVIEPLTRKTLGIDLPANSGADLITMDLPRGRYVITAIAALISNGTGTITCSLVAGDAAGSTSVIWRSPEALYQASQPLQLVTTKATRSVTMNCSTNATPGAAGGSIVAIPIG